MYEQIFYNSIDVKSASPIDKRLYVNELTVPELTNVFSNGKYAFLNAVVFNKADKSFYYLSNFTIESDALNVNNWIKITSSTSTFIEWSDQNYTVGSCVYIDDGGGNKTFYIARTDTVTGETPTTHLNKWLEVGIGGTVGQKYQHRLNPNDVNTHTFTFDVDTGLTANGNIPIITVWGDFGETENSRTVLSIIEPKISSYNDGSTQKVTIVFSGDMSDLKYDIGDTSHNNIIVELR